jgi:cell division protein FtsN
MNQRPFFARQRGGFVLGLVIGLLIGLLVALAVALFITRTPVPFVNKVPPRTAEQDQAEQLRNRNWDPNAPLAGRAGKLPLPAPGPASAPDNAASAASAPGTADASAAASSPVSSISPIGPISPASTASAAQPSRGGAARDPAAILAGGGDAGSAPGSGAAGRESYVFFVQVGAFSRSEEAEQQRARLALLGLTARLSEREQAGRTVYRVRLGPVENRSDAESLQQRLQDAGMASQLVRAERP